MMRLSRPQREHLAHELRQFDASCSLKQARRPPVSWFLDPWMFQLQQEYIFQKTWQIAALREDVAAPGSTKCVEVAGQSLVLIRDAVGILRAFPNSCTHWGTRLVCEDVCPANERIQCRNHRWTWNLEGKLLGAPETPRGFCKSGLYDLECLPISEWGPFVWVCMDSDVPDLAAWMGPLYECGSHFAAMNLEVTSTHDISASWLHVMDNYNDCLYHRSAHPGLAEAIGAKYDLQLFEQVALQTAPFKKKKGTVRSGQARYWSLFPNMMFNESGDNVFDVNVVIPTAPDRCTLEFYYFFPEGTDNAFMQESMKSGLKTQEEDTLLCAWIREGLSLHHDRRGPYVPSKEAGVHLWHRLVHQHLLPLIAPPTDEL